MHTKIKKGKDLPSAAVESPSHDRQRGRAWFRPPRGRRTLSGTPRPDVQVHHTAGSAAPHVHASTNRPLAGPRAQDREKERERSRQDKRGEHFRTRGERSSSMNRRETTKKKQARQPRASCLSAFCSAGLRPSLRPVFGSASLRASARSLSKGGVPSRPPSPRAMRGTGEVSFGSGPRNYSPKMRPLLHMNSEL